MNKILVCTDGSAYSFVCYDYAAWMAQRAGAALEVLYVSDLRQFEVPMVADLSGSLGVQPYQAVLGKLQEFEQERAKAILEQARKHLAAKTPPVVATFTHKLGFLVDTFHDFEAHVDLIMLGKRGENANFATEHLGSTMERVVRASHKPCLVTSRAFKAVERILFSHDGGKSCQKALEFLVTSSAFKDLELHVVTVAAHHDEEAALKTLQAAEGVLRAAGYHPLAQMLVGQPDNEIAAYVEGRGINLLIMGAYGHSRIRQLIIGSTTTSMIRRCKIPVLLFR
ncbi:MAG TPA: universal stress protein [Opitutaceae bacterium]|nr:universal stress protein [Opitutaceae bacterium]